MKGLFLKLLLFFALASSGQEYIQIIKPSINIRMEPNTSSSIIGSALNGEIYITNGEVPKWYRVLLPSGESRWIYKKLAQKVISKGTMPDNLDILVVQEELKIASDEANKDANTEIIKDLNKIEINNLLFDQYTLLVLQNYSINPAEYEYIMTYSHPSGTGIIQPVSENLVSVSHVDYDLFKVDGLNIYIETRRCFKLGAALDAMIFMYYANEDFVQKLCFEDGYGSGFDNCYNIKNIYKSVMEEPNLVVLTKEGKMRKTNLVLKETVLKIPE
tara:strand:+ start:2645 stop:3463 length:819 start_codon:yes stop_codon:yes gene_type:complete